MSDSNWSDLHSLYKQQDWINKPSIFAETALLYFPKNGKLLDLGAGLGQDSIYFAKCGYRVTATDLNIMNLQGNITHSPEAEKISLKEVDLRQALPFDDASYEVVYAHLSLHYFDTDTTEQLFAEIQRVLKPGGVLAFFTNSVNDPEYGTGREIEPDYFEIDGVAKRYFSAAAAASFARAFQPLLVDDAGETYKDQVIGVHNLIRYIGTKPAE